MARGLLKVLPNITGEVAMHRLVIVVALAITTLTVGCGAAAHGGRSFTSARVTHVVQQDTGGVVELSGPIVPATEDAMLVLTEHCGGRWRRLESEQAVAMRAGAAEGKSSDEESWMMDDDRLIAYECTTRAGR